MPEMDSASPFAAILAGQPTLNRQLRMRMFAALDQRIATRFTIKPMDLAESAAYLRHHLKLARPRRAAARRRRGRPAAPGGQRAAISWSLPTAVPPFVGHSRPGNFGHAVCSATTTKWHWLKTWHILRKLRCCPWRAGQFAKAIHVLQTREANAG
jgi:hypothetical protein